jgi:hypothetical protein
MRTIASDGDSVRSANRYLLPHEQQLITIRRHPAILLGPSLVILAELGAIVALSSLFKFSGSVLLAVWLVWSVLLFRLIWKVINWSVDYFIVTSDRMLLIRGVLARDVVMIPFGQLIDFNYELSSLRPLLSYGSFTLEVADQNMPPWEIGFLPYPEQLFLEVFPIVHPYLPGESGSG